MSKVHLLVFYPFAEAWEGEDVFRVHCNGIDITKHTKGSTEKEHITCGHCLRKKARGEG